MDGLAAHVSRSPIHHAGGEGEGGRVSFRARLLAPYDVHCIEEGGYPRRKMEKHL